MWILTWATISRSGECLLLLRLSAEAATRLLRSKSSFDTRQQSTGNLGNWKYRYLLLLSVWFLRKSFLEVVSNAFPIPLFLSSELKYFLSTFSTKVVIQHLAPNTKYTMQLLMSGKWNLTFFPSCFCFHLRQPIKTVHVLLSVGHRRSRVSWDCFILATEKIHFYK